MKILVLTIFLVLSSCSVEKKSFRSENGAESADVQVDSKQKTPLDSSAPERAGEKIIDIGVTPVENDPEEEASLPLVTRFPIVFLHGFLDCKVLSFKGVTDALGSEGFKAFQTKVDSTSEISDRAEQLVDQINKILADSNLEKINIVAHSMGGLDARYLVSALNFGDRVASLSTIATPHRGSPIADAFALPFLGPVLFDTLSGPFNAFCGGEGQAVKSDFIDAVKNLTSNFLEKKFNLDVIDDPNVYYQSWGARTGPQTKDKNKVITQASQVLISKSQGENDGLVSVSSSVWGTDRGVIDADHLDLVGLGAETKEGKRFDYQAFYLKLARELAEMGF